MNNHTDVSLVPANPAALDVDRASEIATRIEEWAVTCDDLDALREALARVAAVESYLAKRHKDASREMARADRKLEARIGELLPREQGKRTDLISTDNLAGVPAKLTRTERREFRQIAEYQDHPEVKPLIEQGQSRRRVLRQIAEVKPVEAPIETDPLVGESWELRVGDFRTLLADVPDESVDLIVTDPPYPKDDLPLYSDLAALARRVLKPRGLLFVWTGQIFLPEVIERLGEHMTYGWTFDLALPGSNSRIMGRHIIQTWKPVLAYSTGTWPSGEWGDDALVSPERAKTTFEWEQSAAPAVKLIERYTAPNALIVDPFTGAGSFGVAATMSGRRFLGVELDPQRADKAADRLADGLAA